MYIASVLESECIDVSIFDCLISDGTRIKSVPGGIHQGVEDDYFKDVVAKQAPDIVGITCPFTPQIDNFLHAAGLVKEANPDIVVIGGGPHFSVTNKDFLLQNQSVDCLISGEGEFAMLEVVKDFKNGIGFCQIAGAIFRHTDRQRKEFIGSNPLALINDLDSIPYPAYHLIDMDLFFHFQAKGLSARLDTGKRTISMITSRGCPFGCVFCSIHLHMGRKIRVNSPDYVVAHIEKVVDEYSVEHIFFEDDNFCARPTRAEKIFDVLVKRNISITWSTPNGVRADTLSEPLLEAMKMAGCIRLFVASESGDQEVLDKIIGKRLKLDSVIRTAEWCKKLGIPLTSFFVIGFPGETKEKIQKTIDFAYMLYEKYDVTPLLNIATPLVGSKLYDIVIKEGYLVRDITPESLSGATQPFSGKGLIRTADFTPGDLKAFAKQLDTRIKKISPDFDVSFHV